MSINGETYSKSWIRKNYENTNPSQVNIKMLLNPVKIPLRTSNGKDKKNKNLKIAKRILNKNNKGHFAVPHILKRYCEATAIKILQYVYR